MAQYLSGTLVAYHPFVRDGGGYEYSTCSTGRSVRMSTCLSQANAPTSGRLPTADLHPLRKGILLTCIWPISIPRFNDLKWRPRDDPSVIIRVPCMGVQKRRILKVCTVFAYPRCFLWPIPIDCTWPFVFQGRETTMATRPGFTRKSTDRHGDVTLNPTDPLESNSRTYELRSLDNKDRVSTNVREDAGPSGSGGDSPPEYEDAGDGFAKVTAPVETAKDLVTQVIHVDDDPSLNPYTFRLFFLGRLQTLLQLGT